MEVYQDGIYITSCKLTRSKSSSGLKQSIERDLDEN